MAEQIDVYDANLRHLGAMDRDQAHLQGQWHRAFHCWVVSAEEGGRVLLQRRAGDTGGYSGLLDVSAAGHLEAGEAVADGVREVTEELGIEVDPARLHHLGERVEVCDQTNGQRNREFQSVHLYRCDAPLSAYRPDPAEVSALLWLPLTPGMELFTGGAASLAASGVRHEASGGGRWEECEMEVTPEMFVPRIQRYYLTTLIMAERLLRGAGPLAVS